MINKLMPGQSIGIIGGGQLGKMLAQSGQRMGYKISTYDPNPQACSFPVSHRTCIADFDDEVAMLSFVSQEDAITYEFENIDGEILEAVAQNSNFPQGSKLLIQSQNRVREKSWLQSIGIDVVDFYPVNDWDDLLEGIQSLDFPLILKTSQFGYDGKGQFRLDNASEFEEVQPIIKELVQNQACILEKVCPFERELSVIVARDQYDRIEVFPVSHNIHQSGILFSSLVGEGYDFKIVDQMKDYAYRVAKEGDLVGVCGIEFFLTSDGRVWVNEIAPRPHNTGHYTIEATNVSQFDQHILAVTGHPIHSINLWEPSLMVNILGQHLEYLEEAMRLFPEAHFHIYDKGEAKKQRKMGHFTIMSPDVEELKALLDTDFLKFWRSIF